MSTLDECFVKALKSFVEKEKSQRAFALKYDVVTPVYLNKILLGKKYGSDETKRALASALGYPGAKYEDFLNIGRALLAGKEPPEPEPHCLTADEMSERGFFAVPFSDNMKLAAGNGGRIQVDEDVDTSNIIIHGPSLNRHNAKGLQAFRVGGDSMEPLIAKNGIVLADTKQNDIRHIHDGAIYVLCWDREDGECAVKYLHWAEKNRLLSVESENSFYRPVFRHPKEVLLIGRVIWSWREH